MSQRTTKFINREISWLAFNHRVLQEAADERVPLIERLRFLGIYANNKDEFFRVRVASLRRLADLLSPVEADQTRLLLEKIARIDLTQQREFERIHARLMAELSQQGIEMMNECTLTDEQKVFVRQYFQQELRQHLFPIMIRNIRRSSILEDRAVYLAVHMHCSRQKRDDEFALIRLPVPELPRFLLLPATGRRRPIIHMDDVIRVHLPDIFPIFRHDQFSAYTIKLTRDAELELDGDLSKSLAERMTESLKQRRKGRPVRIIYDRAMPVELLNLVMQRLKISARDNLVPGGRYHNFRDYMHFPDAGLASLSYPQASPQLHPRLQHCSSLLSEIRKADVMLHFPYQSFQSIIDLLREASIDKKVKCIKMTIYRAARNSKVINALINAARNGKEVVVFLELQARFDEQANLYWAGKLREEGVKVLYGRAGLKVHAKLMLIHRRESGRIVLYANVGTGNFNEETARVYTDISLLTARPEITSEVDMVFSLFEHSYFSQPDFRELIVSPFSTRRFLEEMIDREISQAQRQLPAGLLIKCNSLVDESLAEKLCEAARAGVKCRLIIRGICVIVPEDPSLGNNLEAISIVDRYLEHARIFVFHNAGEPLYYISSADLMGRNLDHRIEVSCQVKDQGLQKELQHILDLQWADNVKSRLHDGLQQNHYRGLTSGTPLRSQQEIHQYYADKIN